MAFGKGSGIKKSLIYLMTYIQTNQAFLIIKKSLFMYNNHMVKLKKWHSHKE